MQSMYNLDDRIVVAERVRVCRSPAQRTRGLIGTRRLDADQAVWILDCGAIHTFFMTLTIDVAFLDEDLKVVKTVHELTPWRICLAAPRTRSVLEGPVGMLDRGRLRRGSRLQWLDANVQPLEAMTTGPPCGSAQRPASSVTVADSET